MDAILPPDSGLRPPQRWLQLLLGVLCMSMIANLQYGWTLFVTPISQHFHWERAAIQVAFTIFVLAETWLLPFIGFVVDQTGPRRVVLSGGVLVALSWAIDSVADTLPLLYLAAAIGGLGAGAVYATCVGNALKWFPDRRGLAAGLTAMGFGAGSALTVQPIAQMIATQGFQATFLTFGLAQGGVIFTLGWLLRKAPAGLAGPPSLAVTIPVEAGGAPSAARDYTPRQMLATPVFWVMYAMFVMMAVGGLMATAQLGPIATDFNIAGVPVTLLGLTLPALTFALSIDRFLNGVTRPIFGWVSDFLGRENTMFVAFGLEGLGTLALSHFGHDPIAFVILTGLVFFAWGEIYSLFPATCGDSYGARYATVNSGILYTAKGVAAILVPLSSILAKAGGWSSVFWLAAGLNLTAALMAVAVLKPLRARMRASDR